MGIIRKLMIRLFAPRSVKIHEQFGDVIVQTTEQINRSDDLDDSIKELMIIWLVSLPWAYFEALFINNNSWNESLLASFENTQVTNGEDCASITQAFFLWHLEQLTKNNENYKKYSINEAERWINKRMNKGTLLTDRLGRFRKNLQDLPPDDWHFEYVNEILNAIYTDHEKASNISRAIQNDSKLRLHLMTNFVEMIRRVKHIDVQK